MSRLSALAYPNDAPIHGLTDIRLAYSRRIFYSILGVTPSPSHLAALDKTRQHPLLATQTSAVLTTTCLDYLHSHIRTMRPSMASPTYLQPTPPTDIGCDTLAPRSRQDTPPRQHPLLATQTSTVLTTTFLDYLHSHIRTMRPSTASPIYV
jgi:uncharacterized protein YbdZ (MbtH family)